MSTSYVHYPNTGGGGGGGDVTGIATPTADGSGYRPIPVYTDDTGKIIGAKGLDGGGGQQFGVNSAGTALKVGTIVVDGFNAYITDTFGVGFQFGAVGLYLISDLITFPATKNLGVASGGHYNFLEGSLNRLSLGFAHGDAFTAGPAGSITVKAGTNLTISADKALFSAGIGVGNSAAATTPGSVVRKIEIFDAAGTSLGFIPVYDSIT